MRSPPSTSLILPSGVAYGLHVIRIDGNDIFAVYNAVKQARKIAVEQKRSTLIEAMTYRVGHHSTSDDYTRYRSPDAVSTWVQGKNPITRYAAVDLALLIPP